MRDIRAIDAFGSYRLKGRKWDIVEIKGPVFGPSYHSQLFASYLKPLCYLECHMNASASPEINYAMAIGKSKASAIEERLANAFLRNVCAAFPGMGNSGLRTATGGSGNISRVSCPALLLEPGFLTCPPYYQHLISEGYDRLGVAIGRAVTEIFPEGGLVAFRLGHAYRGKNGETKDPGALVKEPDPDPAFDTEIETANLYMQATIDYLLAAA